MNRTPTSALVSTVLVGVMLALVFAIALAGCESHSANLKSDAAASGAAPPETSRGGLLPFSRDHAAAPGRSGEMTRYSTSQVTGAGATLEARPRGDLRSSVAPDEEVWVIARAATETRSANDDLPGGGSLVCAPRSPTGEPAETIPLPLEHTSVSGSITGYIASVNVRQQFHNPYDEKIEAVYVFPLPQSAAVSDFVMTIGERRIRGIIREREQAERIYAEARRQGYTASLLTQERPNIFTQRVANIEPAKRIDVDITYFNTLTYSDGWFEFVFPMVVGPRFNPPNTTDGVGAVARGAHGASGQATEIQYLRPDERSGHDIDLELTIDAGVPVEEIRCSTHEVERAAMSSAQARITLSPRDSIPNKDFVLRYRVAGDAPKASMLAHRDERGGFFTLMVYPPQSVRGAERAPLEMVFVVDCSGSMKGEPIAKARRAVERALLSLEPGDTFQVIRFSNDSSTFGPAPVPATDANIRRGLRFVKSLKADGGTYMLRGLRAALDFPHDPGRLRYVTFLTDGYIGNESQILGAVHTRLGASRIFSFGVGSAPNRYLLSRMAKMGSGVVAYVGLNDDPAQVIDLFVERIGHPAMTDVTIDWGGLDVRGVYPERTPDLFAGRPILLTGRFDGSGTATVRLRGRAGGEAIEIPVAVNIEDASASTRAIASVWARSKIAALMDRSTYERDTDLLGEVRSVALEYGLMSAYTAFIAVDSSRRTEGDHGTTVPVAVPVPDGVRYGTTVADQGQ